MRKLISFLIFGLTISLISSCKEDILITHEYTVKGCINNNSSDSLDIQWYWTNYEEPRSYSMSLAPGEFQEIDDGDDADVPFPVGNTHTSDDVLPMFVQNGVELFNGFFIFHNDAHNGDSGFHREPPKRIFV